MVGLAASVESVPCAHLLEAWTVEERLIDSLQPPYNRRSRNPRRGWWLSPPSGRAIRGQVERNPEHPFALGPFRRAEDARSAWQDLVEATGSPPDAEQWATLVTGRDSATVRAMVDRIDSAAAAGAFERAARLRDRAAVLVRILTRQQELAATACLPELVLAQPGPGRTWAVAIVRHGRLAASGIVPAGAAPLPVIDSLRAGATTVQPGPGPFSGATAAEIRNVHRWIDSAPTRIVSVAGCWTLPLDGAHTLTDWADRAERAASGISGAEVSSVPR